MNNYKITLGPNAYSFHDQSTGITLAKGEVKTITPAQFSNRRIRKAINSGHLQIVMDVKEPKKYTDKEIERLNTKLKKFFDKGVEPAKTVKSFSLEELNLIAKFNDIEPDNDDTNITLVEAIFESYGEE